MTIDSNSWTATQQMRDHTTKWRKARVYSSDGSSSEFSYETIHGTIRARTFGMLMQTAAYFLDSQLFVLTDATFFGFHLNVLRDANPSVLEGMTIRWKVEHGRVRARTDGPAGDESGEEL